MTRVFHKFQLLVQLLVRQLERLTLTVQQTLQSDDNVTVSYATANGTALAGSDFTAVSDNVTIIAGQTSATFDVTITNDTIDEHNENFTVQLSNPVNAAIGTGTATVQITDEDLPPIVSIADNTSSESDGSMTFTVSLDNTSEKDFPYLQHYGCWNC